MLSSTVNTAGPKSKASNYFVALDSTTESLQERTQQLIDKINENRKKDHMLMNNFRESLLMKVQVFKSYRNAGILRNREELFCST